MKELSIEQKVKPSWSEEDEKILNIIIARLHSHPNVELEEYGKDYHWLKSLKDRVQPQPKQEWSEEDEEILNTIINHFKIDIECTDEDDIVRWLNSIKDRYTWKPSDEQITWLYRAADNASKDSRMKQVLNELLSNLKKLRGE